MIVIRDPMQVGSIPDPGIRSLGSQGLVDMCDGEAFDTDIHGYMIVVESADSVSMLEQEAGFPIMGNLFDDARFGDADFSPCFEVLEEHAECYEMVFIPTDGDFSIGIFIPKQAGVDAGLLAMCTQYAVPAPELV